LEGARPFSIRYLATPALIRGERMSGEEIRGKEKRVES